MEQSPLIVPMLGAAVAGMFAALMRVMWLLFTRYERMLDTAGGETKSTLVAVSTSLVAIGETLTAIRGAVSANADLAKEARGAVGVGVTQIITTLTVAERRLVEVEKRLSDVEQALSSPRDRERRPDTDRGRR